MPGIARLKVLSGAEALPPRRSGQTFPKRTPKPLVVFDMNFFDANDFQHPAQKPRPAVSPITMAARCLSTVLRKHNIATSYFLDRFGANSGAAEINLPEELKAGERPLFFALSLYDHYFERTQAEVKAIKSAYPQAKILLGGPSVNTTTDLRTLAAFFPEVAAFVKGDGEVVITELVYALSTGPIDRKRIAGLQGVYVKSSDFEYVDERPNRLSVQELNGQPGITAYPALVKDIQIEGCLDLHTSRGCKYRCVFCSHQYFSRPIYWTADRIIQELERVKLMVERGILPSESRLIRFTDDDFFQDRERAAEFLKKVAENPSLRHFFGFIFQCSVGSFFRTKELDEELLDLLTKVKTNAVKLGTDGFHPEALKYFKKGGYTWNMALKLMAALARRRIHQTHYVILSYPSMTLKAFVETLLNIYGITTIIKSGFSLEMRPFLIALESNALMETAERITEPRALSAGNNAKKLLPITLPIEDPLVFEAVNLVFDLPFFSERALRRLARKSRNYRSKRNLISIARELRRTGAGNIALYQALFSRNLLVNEYAVEEMLAALKVPLPA